MSSESPTRPLAFCAMLICYDRWDRAEDWLRLITGRQLESHDVVEAMVPGALIKSGDRAEIRRRIDAFVDHLFSLGDSDAGDLAICWMMLTADPRRTTTFNRFMPQLARLCEGADDDAKARLTIWWHAAKGMYADDDVTQSIFLLADQMTDGDRTMKQIAARMPLSFGALRRRPLENHVVVMANAPDNLAKAWEPILGEALPLVVAGDVVEARRRLHAEYPHATHVVDALLRDVKEDKPLRFQPTLLLGPAGSGKSRLVRRLAEETGGLPVVRYDGAASHDAMFSGSPRAWANSQASVPARGILQHKSASLLVMIDEIEKAGSGTYHGRLWDAVIPYLERETSARYPETCLDTTLDLSHVSYIATANSVDALPGPLLDRFRILLVPAPTLAHLPALAAQVMRDLARHDEDRMHEEPLADDELAVIGRSWRAERFSMRKLQRIVATTLEVRDAMARRH